MPSMMLHDALHEVKEPWLSMYFEHSLICLISAPYVLVGNDTLLVEASRKHWRALADLRMLLTIVEYHPSAQSSHKTLVWH